MKICKTLAHFGIAALLTLPICVNAALVPLPALDIQNLTSGATEDGLDDAGASISINASPASSSFDIDATAFTIITDGGPVDITNQSFSLSSTGLMDSGMGSFSGTFTVGGGLLSGSFDSLTLVDLGSSMFTFEGEVLFTGGSLMANNNGLLSGSIIGNDVAAKVGAVVPVPAAVWLFGSGLIGLVGIARRKTA